MREHALAVAEAHEPPPAEPKSAAPAGERHNMFEAVEGRWGSREIEITDVKLFDLDGEPSFVFHSGDPMSIRMKVLAHAPVVTGTPDAAATRAYEDYLTRQRNDDLPNLHLRMLTDLLNRPHPR